MKKVNRNNGAIDVTTVGGRIKKLRTDAGFTQEELAARLHLEGKSVISNYENNNRGVSAEMLTQLSRLFHVSADYILNGDSPDNLDPIVNEALEIDKFKRQIDNLVNMCADGDISREVFRSKKKKLEDQILNLEKLNDECRQNIFELEDIGAKDRRIDSLSEFIKMTAFDTRAKIPETVIDNFVD